MINGKLLICVNTLLNPLDSIVLEWKFGKLKEIRNEKIKQSCEGGVTWFL